MNRTSLLARGALALALGCGLGAALKSRRQRFSFAGRVVVITGGSRGLGLLIARQLAAEGARLASPARNVEELRNEHM